MYRFEHIQAFYLLVPALLLILIFILYKNDRKRRLQLLGDLNIQNSIVTDISRIKTNLKFILALSALILIITGLANLQVAGKLRKKANSKTIDLILAIDISRSMLAEDARPNRLERAKMLAMNLIDQVNFAKTGIVLFAGESFIHLPITSDKGAARMFISSVSTDLISLQGTAIGAALETADSAFQRTNAKNKAIVLISDGENFEDDPIPYAEQAAKDNIVIHTVVLGSDKGAPIPMKEKNQTVGFIKDKEGNTVMTKPDVALLSQIAKETGGISVNGEQLSQSVEKLKAELDKLEKDTSGSLQFSDYETLFTIFGIPALLLLLLDFFIYEKRMKWQNSLRNIMQFSINPQKRKIS